MHPVLITIGSFRLPTFGVVVGLALVLAIYAAVKLGESEGLDPNRLLDFSIWLFVVAYAGAKVLMIVSDWREYQQNPGEILSWNTLQSAGVFYGGFIAAVLFAVWYIRVYRLPLAKVFDAYAPSVALGQSVGRLGCFAAGCDYGRPTSNWLGVVFTNPISHELTGVPLGVRVYPTQVLESMATFGISAVLLWRYRHKRRDGEIFLLYLTLYAIARFFLEFLRGDEDRGFVFHHALSTSQFIAILAVAAAIVLKWLWGRSGQKSKDSQAFSHVRAGKRAIAVRRG